MQLKPKARLRGQLLAASCALLGATTGHGEDIEDFGSDGSSDGWTFDTGLGYYQESGRIRAIEPVINAQTDLGNGQSAGFNLTFDSLSGASPNGALPSRSPQTFASPSGNSLTATPTTYTTASGSVVSQAAPIYTIAPGQLPEVPNYRDTRVALSGNWSLPLSRLIQASFGAKVSIEHDFHSLSVNSSISRDFFDKNTTLSLSVNGEFDQINPIGGTPVAGSDYALFQKTGNESKSGAGLELGLTQVMTQYWLTQLNVSADRFTGYLNDPYKILSVINAGGNTTGYLYENRPGERLRRSVYLENRVGWGRGSAVLSLRYMTDDWGIRSDTAELRYRWWTAERGAYLEPSVRWYRQNAASFYRPWIWNTDGPITYASADQRLSAFDARTYGLKFGYKPGDDGGSELTVKLEYYEQVQHENVAVPLYLQGLDLFPGLKAILFQVGWSF